MLWWFRIFHIVNVENKEMIRTKKQGYIEYKGEYKRKYTENHLIL